MADKTEKKPGFVARMKAAVKGFCNRVAKFFRDTKSELKKVVWPTPQQVLKNAAIVIGCVIAVGIFIWLFDFVAQFGIDALISVFH